MRYVLPTVPTLRHLPQQVICGYKPRCQTLPWQILYELSNFHVFNNQYWFYSNKTVFFVLDHHAVRLRECPWRTV